MLAGAWGTHDAIKNPDPDNELSARSLKWLKRANNGLIVSGAIAATISQSNFCPFGTPTRGG